MSYPSDPKNPYGGGAYGGNPYGGQPGYGYPQQSAAQPGYGYPQYPAGGAPHGVAGPGTAPQMQGQVITARVLLFVAGSIWLLMSIFMLIGGFAAKSMLEDIPGMDGGAALGVALLLFLLFAAMGALHIVPAAVFGRGGTGARVTAIIGASLNSVLALIYVAASIVMLGEGEDGAGALLFLSVLWAGTAVPTVVFLSMGQAGQWFNRPRY